MSKTTKNSDLNDVSADDLALWSAVVVIIGDLFALLAVIKARSEKQ